MIIGSVLLILVAAGLVVAGLYANSASLCYSSIVMSVVAAFALIVGLRRSRAGLGLSDHFELGQADVARGDDVSIVHVEGPAPAQRQAPDP